MNRLLLLFACATFLLVCLGCSGTCNPIQEPVLRLQSPIWPETKPILRPSGYVMPTQQRQVQYQQVPMQVAPPPPALCPPQQQPVYQLVTMPAAAPVGVCR